MTEYLFAVEAAVADTAGSGPEGTVVVVVVVAD